MTKAAGRICYPPTPQIKRILRSLRDCGVSVGSVVIHPDGTIEVSQSPIEPNAPQNDFDRLDAAGLL